MKHRWYSLFVVIIFFAAYPFQGCSNRPPAPKNIILFISDGCGYYQKDIASIFEHGQVDMQPYSDFPVRLAMSTWSMNAKGYDPDSAWASFDWVRRKPTDSAASGTAIATGIKTFNGKLGVDSSNVPREITMAYLDKLGKATGVVSSVLLSEATPAAFVVHHPDRNDHETISRMMIEESDLEVIMACGHPYFDDQARPATDTTYKHVGGEETWQAILNGEAGNKNPGNEDLQPWTFVETKEQFLDLMEGETPERVLGIPQVLGTLQKHRGGDSQKPPFEVPLNTTVPSLPEMTLAAINVVDEDPDGFFLMIEGGAIDWAGHGNQIGRLIEEEIDFNHAVGAAIEWVEKNSSWDETLIIVTADHETGYLTGPGSGKAAKISAENWNEVWKPLVNNGKGNVPGHEWHSGSHTNTLVPFYAKGAGSEALKARADQVDPVRGPYLDNTEIAQTIFSFYKK